MLLTEFTLGRGEVRRISLFGGPGVGKSTVAAKIYSYLKSLSYDVEYIQEYIKLQAYEGKKPQNKYDDLYVFFEQLRKEENMLRYVEVIVTDSPLWLNATYNSFRGGFSEVNQICETFDKEYSSLNLLLERPQPQGLAEYYSPRGRFENYDEACKMDTYIKKFLEENQIKTLNYKEIELEKL